MRRCSELRRLQATHEAKAAVEPLAEVLLQLGGCDVAAFAMWWTKRLAGVPEQNRAQHFFAIMGPHLTAAERLVGNEQDAWDVVVSSTCDVFRRVGLRRANELALESDAVIHGYLAGAVTRRAHGIRTQRHNEAFRRRDLAAVLAPAV